MPHISQLFIYPVKSLGGIGVSSAQLTDRGFQYDRRWMLVDEHNLFFTQRDYPQMALLQTAIADNGIVITHKDHPRESVVIPFSSTGHEKVIVNVWDDLCEAIVVDPQLNEWFSDKLRVDCKLVHMPEETHRKVDRNFALHENDITAFSDGYPLLVIGQSSLDDLNSRLETALPMNRFRPNIVLSGTEPYEEDEMKEFRIGDIHFYGVKLSARCVMTTINQDSLEKGKEPLKTLHTYRMMNNKVYFGQNVLHAATGTLKTGDEVKIISRKNRAEFVKLV